MVSLDRNSLLAAMRRLEALISLAEDAMGLDRSLTPLERRPRMTQPNGSGEDAQQLWETRRRAWMQEYRATARFLGVSVHVLGRRSDPRQAHESDGRGAHGGAEVGA